MIIETEIHDENSKPIDETDNDLCRALWISVIVQAMIDIGLRSRHHKNHSDRSDVLQWLASDFEEPNDFDTVCSLAGVESSEIRKVMKEILRGRTSNIDFRATKKALTKNREQEDRKRYFRRARKNQQNRLKKPSLQFDSNNRRLEVETEAPSAPCPPTHDDE